MESSFFSFLLVIASVVIFFSLNAALTAAVRWSALRTGYLDIPNERSLHQTPVPKSGGIAFVSSFLLLTFLFYLINWLPYQQFLALFFGGFVIAAIGFWDDHKNLSARRRIVFHFVGAIWAISWVGPLTSLSFGAFTLTSIGLLVLLTLVGLVWLLNLYNFMDGNDGLATSEGIFVASIAAILLYLHGGTALAALSLSLAIALAGFLMWNWAPAKIFMGDTGSCFLGYTFGVFMIISAAHGWIEPWTWLILLGVFITDTTVTLFRRMRRGYRFYQSHCNHAYHHAARRFASHKKLTYGVIWVNVLWLLPMALLSDYWPEWGFYITLIAYIPLFVLAFYFRAGLQDGDPE